MSEKTIMEECCVCGHKYHNHKWNEGYCMVRWCKCEKFKETEE